MTKNKTKLKRFLFSFVFLFSLEEFYFSFDETLGNRRQERKTNAIREERQIEKLNN